MYAIPTAPKSSKWVPFFVNALARAAGGPDVPVSMETVQEGIDALTGQVNDPVVASAAAYNARALGYAALPKRGWYALTSDGWRLATEIAVHFGEESFPTPAPVTTSAPVADVAKVAEIIPLPVPTVNPGVTWTPPVVEADPYAGADDYLVGLAAQATPCFGSYSARAKATCGICPLAARCAASALTRVAEIAATIVREEADAIRLAAEAEARAIREAAEAEEARIRAEREAEDAARWAAEADEARRKMEAAAAAESIFDTPTATPNTGTGTSSGLANILASMAAATAPVAPVSGGTPLTVAFDAVCAHCRNVIPRDSSAVALVGRGLFHTSCAHNA